ncbi:hypothetical protein V8C37DRAFT_371437 [Trichoderma ceciliae]
MTSAHHKPGGPSQKAARSPHSHRSPRSHLRHHSRRISNQSPRVVLGHGAVARLPTELNKLSLSFPLIICSPSRLSLANRIRSLLPNLDAYIIDSDTHPGSATLSGRDSVISVGGPRAVAMARRISLKMGIPHVCVPTTHSGAAGDLSPWGKRTKDCGRLKSLEEESRAPNDHGNTSLPTVIIYDEKLTESRIRRFSAPSGVFVGPDADADADVAVAVFPRSVDKADVDASVWRSAKSSTSQWSYIHLPGV